MRAKSRKRAEDSDATFVFKGTIKRLRASNVKQAPASDRTAIVTVNNVIHAPPNLAGYAGQDITVELSKTRNVTAGAKMIFYATSWLYAENIAVHSLREEPDAGDATTTHHVDAVAQRDRRKTRAHFDDADLVISGKVVAVRLPSVAATTKKKTTSRDETTRASEHDPKWREAIIDVEQVHKGSQSKGRVVVRFPSSTDVAWRRAPKFEAGQQGYFMLHKMNQSAVQKKTKRQVSSSSATASAQTYTVRNPQDFQPYNETGGIKSLIESESHSNNG